MADRPENGSVVEGLLAVLAGHMRGADRDTGTLPDSGDVRPILDRYLLPDDDRR